MSVIDLDRTHQGLGKANRRRVLAEIILDGPIARTEIAGRSGLTNASVSRITRDLIEAGLVTEGQALPAPNKPGRRFVGLSVNAQGGCVLGIGLNAFEQNVTLADLGNRALARRALALGSLADPQEVLVRVAKAAAAMIRESDISRDRIFGGSVAITGAVDPSTGILRAAPALGWKDVPIAPFLSDRLGLPVHVESLPNAMNLAENRFGLSRQYENCVAINASLGIGASLLMDRHLVRGRNFSAGLIGRLRLGETERGGRLEVDHLAGGWGVLSQLEGRRSGSSRRRDQAAPARQLTAVIDDAEAGDLQARSALETAGGWLGSVIETIGALVHPEVFILSGPLSRSPCYVEAVRNSLASKWPREEDPVPLRLSRMSSQAAARWLAINEFLIHRDLDLARLKPAAAA